MTENSHAKVRWREISLNFFMNSINWTVAVRGASFCFLVLQAAQTLHYFLHISVILIGSAACFLRLADAVEAVHLTPSTLFVR